MIDIIKIEKLRNPELASLGSDLEKIFLPYDLLTLGLKTETDKFLAFWEEFRSFFGLEKGSLLTKSLEDLDERRDKALKGIYGVAENYSFHFDSNLSQASARVTSVFDKYGKSLYTLNYQTETETIRSLVNDFEKDLLAKTALNILGLTAWPTELKDANEAFNKAFIDRNKETSVKPDGSQSSRRKQAYVVYRELMEYIRSAQRFAPMPKRLELIAEINSLIAKYNALVDSRGGNSEESGQLPTPDRS